MKPKFFMPVHGEFRMLKIHTQLAQDTGVPRENCFIMENGDMLALTPDTARLAGHFNAGDVYVDGSGIGDIGNVVLRDRRILSEEGLVLAVATVDIEKKEILAGPDILSRGFVYMRESGEMISEGQSILFHALREALSQSDCNEYKLREAMSAALQPFLFEKTERHPMILSMIMTLDEE
jgi:ribonuclease J